MAVVYILKSLSDGGYYVGSTRNLDDRIKRHLAGRSLATRNRRPLELVFTKQFETYAEAYQFERYIKKQKNKKFIEALVSTLRNQHTP